MSHNSRTLESNRVLGTARFARNVTKGLAAVVSMTFGWLQLNQVALSKLVHSLPAAYVVKFGLVAFYWCWVAGVLRDIDYQELVFRVPPSMRKVVLGACGLGAVIAIAFGVLCYVETFRGLAVALSGFWVADGIGALFMTRVVLPGPLSETRRVLQSEREYLQLARLDVVERYQTGSWQLWKYGMGAAVLAALDLVALSGRVVANNPATNEVWIGIGLVLYIAITEVWQWGERLGVAVALRTLAELEGKYRIELSHKPRIP